MSTPQFAIWSQERFDLLVELWVKKGLTASQCARELGTTRNSVLSKVHRSGIAERTVPRRSGTTYRRKKKPTGTLGKPTSNCSIPGKQSSSFTVKRVELKIDGLPPEPASNVPLNERKKLADIQDDQCRYIHGDTSTHDYHYCNSKQVPGLPYCSYHRSVCFLPVEMKTRKAERDVKMARAKQNELA